METIKYSVTIPKNHEITVKVPDDFPPNQVAEVIVTLAGERVGFDERVQALKEAMHDELFLSDLRAVAEDFKSVDSRDSN